MRRFRRTSERASAPFHGVRFYESSASMAATAAAFLGAGLIRDEVGLVIVGQEHRAAIEGTLREISFSMAALQAAQKLHILDASETLSTVLVSGAPDPGRFTAAINFALTHLRLTGETRLRVYDEMTDLLWKQGGQAAALPLEALWDGLTLRAKCSVLCGHRIEPLSDESALSSLCACHSHIVAPNGAPHPIDSLKTAIAAARPSPGRYVH